MCKRSVSLYRPVHCPAFGPFTSFAKPLFDGSGLLPVQDSGPPTVEKATTDLVLFDVSDTGPPTEVFSTAASVDEPWTVTGPPTRVPAELAHLIGEADELTAILTASANTARRNAGLK